MTTPTGFAKGLLDHQEKKLTVMVPPSIHRDFKAVASARGMSMKDLVLETYHEYIVPKYLSDKK